VDEKERKRKEEGSVKGKICMKNREQILAKKSM
jgi:hypothetical protein